MDYFGLAYEEQVTDVIDQPILTAVRRVIDNKAMRKVRNSEIQFVAENVTAGGTVSLNLLATVRILSGS